jgi:hypothetical protein
MGKAFSAQHFLASIKRNGDSRLGWPAELIKKLELNRETSLPRQTGLLAAG